MCDFYEKEPGSFCRGLSDNQDCSSVVTPQENKKYASFACVPTFQLRQF